MIIRVYRCEVVPGKEAEFRAFAFDQRHPWLKQRPGLRAMYAGRPLPGSDGRGRCMVQIWDDARSLQEAFGEDWRQVSAIPEEARSLIESATVEHYELADEFHAHDFQEALKSI